MNIDQLIEDKETSEVSTSSLVDWSNPPKISDLKQDFTEASGSHDAHISEGGNYALR